MCMKSFPNIKLTTRQFLSLCEQSYFNYGSEAVLYENPSLFGDNTLAKIWSSIYCTKDVIENKFEKLKRMYQLDKLKEMNDIKILSSISCGKEIVGYTISKSIYTKIGMEPITRTQLLYYLLKARQKLQQLEQM